MAYQTRQRDPLLDSQTRDILVRRGEELIGLALFGLAAALMLMILSYTPDDPNFMDATDAVPQNMLGRFGASAAAILMMMVGYGVYALPVAALAWGLRCLAHRGADRGMRALGLPFVVILFAIYSASLTPPAGWDPELNYGLGGIVGETILGPILYALPLPPQTGLKLLAALACVAGLGLLLFSVGMDRQEARSVLRFLIVGVVSTCSMLANAVTGALRSASERRIARREAREETAFAEPLQTMTMHDPVHTPVTEAEPEPALRKSTGLLGRMPILRAREPELEPELVEPDTSGLPDVDLPEGDRVRAKIADAVRKRSTPPAPEPVAPARQGFGFGARRTRAPADPPVSAPIAAAVARVTGRAAAPREEPPLSAEETTQATPAPVQAAGLFARRRPVAPPPQAQPDQEPLPVEGDALAPPPSATPMPAALQRAIAATKASGGAPAEPPRSVVQHVQKRAPAPSRQAMAEAQPSLPLQQQAEDSYELPPLTLLASADTVERHHLSDEALEQNARMLENVLDDYGIKGEIVSVRPGPVVTMYELEPAPGLKASRVIGLADDIARSMSALSARVSTVPGRTVIGIELPNQNREKVVLREILSHRDFGDGNHKLPLALGKDIGGDPIVANLAKMPHLLIAGTTGSGKSVAINTMILSLLYKLKPEDCRMIMIDPKMLELSVYDGIPHLLSPVVTDPKKAVVALKWVVGEMEERYRKMSKMGVRNIDGYNGRVEDALGKNEMFSRTVQTGFDDETGDPVFETEEFAPEKMPYIVVIVDEMADLMMVAGKEIEACIQRLAQMARASGIHIVMATQRPSVDVITGTIKANFPTRISFHVTSKVDSRTILGEMGAEQLLGMGDMLYMAGGAKITRVHGPFVSDEEVEEIVSHLKSFGPPDYAASVLDGPDEDKESDIDAVLGLSTGGNTTGEDALYDQAVAIVVKDRKCSTSYIQRKLGIGYNKAARLVEQMEDAGLVSGANHVGKREILVPEQE